MGELLFAGTNASGQLGLWVTDGTPAGTHELTGINGAFSSSSGGIFGTGPVPYFNPDFTPFDGEVLFSGFDSNGQLNLWITNGTAAGTHELTGISGVILNPIYPDLAPSDLTLFNNEVLFNGDASLWVTNGTAVGTHELTGISGASGGTLNPDSMAVFNGEVLLGAAEGSSLNSELWITNGTAAGTYKLANVGALDLTVLGGEVLFEGNGNLWTTNGTAAGTQELTGISGGYGEIFAGVTGTPDFTQFSDRDILFQGRNASGMFGLWLTNGTAAGTYEIASINGANSGGIFAGGSSNPDFVVFRGEVLFAGTNSIGQKGLWETNGTAAGTRELTDINGAYAGGIFSFNGTYNSFNGSANSPDFTILNGQLFFQGRDSSGNFDLWVTNGTAAGTHEVTDINGAYAGGLFPYDLTSPTNANTSGNSHFLPSPPPPPPMVTNVTASPASGEVTTGNTVVITLDMSQGVVVHGSPTLALNDGGTATYDSAHSNLPAGILEFDYTIAAGQSTSDLKVDGISLTPGATIENITGASAILSGAQNADLGLQINPPPPSLAEYFTASQAVYDDNAVGTTVNHNTASGLTLLLDSRNPLLAGSANWESAGFFAQAFHDSHGNVIIAFEGSVPNLSTAYSLGSVGADADIVRGITPGAFADALTFTQDVLQFLVDFNEGSAPVYLTGHSLGGAEAEYVASVDDESGVTFGAPGDRHPTYSAPVAGQTFINYVDHGDPIGNSGYHFGAVQPVGSSANAALTLLLLDELGPVTGLAVAIELFHLLPHYESDFTPQELSSAPVTSTETALVGIASFPNG